MNNVLFFYRTTWQMTI